MTQVEKRKNWKSRVATFKASGQSASVWCTTHDVKVHQLYYWVSKLNTEDKPTVKQTQWLPIEVGNSNDNHRPKALNIRVGKATIEVAPGFDVSLLSDVIRILTVL